MARDIENVNITLPGESDTIELIVNGEPTEVCIALDSWASAVHADDADTVSGHTVARDVLADEYTNAQIDSMVETAGTVKTVNNVQPDQNGNVQIGKSDIGLGNVDNTSDASKPISTATQAALDLKVDMETGKGLSTNDFTDAEKTKLQDIEAGAQVNTVTGVKGSAEQTYRTGNIDITKANIGLGDVDNTSDLNKPISAATQTALDGKVDKVAGKGLSTNDFTTAEKEKLAGIAAGAEVNVQANWNEADSTADSYIQNKPSIPAKTSDLQNDSGFITGIAWGDVTGTLADQTDLQNALDAKANSVDLAAVATSGEADDVSYDNTGSGLSAANVQGAVDELSSDLSAHTGDTVIHVTATDKANWNAKADDSVVVKSVNGETPTSGNVDLDATDIPTSSGVAIKSVTGNPLTIADALQGRALGVNTSIEPIQDLHGYDHPWAGGAGKNKLENSMTSATVSGVIFTVNDDRTVKVSGTATADAIRASSFSLKAGSYIYNSSVSETFQTFDSYLSVSGTTIARGLDGGSSFTLAEDSTVLLGIRVRNGQTPNVTFKPMIRLASETDPTFAPYSNICPISGISSVNIARTGHNIWDEDWELGGLVWATGQPASASDRIRSKNFCQLFGGKEYYAVGDLAIFFYDSSQAFLNFITAKDTTFTAPQNASYFKLLIQNTTTYGNNVSINIPSTYTSYSAYEGTQTVTVVLGQTVYGGTLNVSTGELVVDRAKKLVSDLSWVYYSDGLFYTDGITYKQYGITNIVSSQYRTSTDAGNGDIWGDNGRVRTYIRDRAFTDVSSFVSARGNCEIVYELATPLTFNLTPAQLNLLSSTNILTTNAEELTVRYYATGQQGNVEGNIAFLLGQTASNASAINSLTVSVAPEETSPATATHASGTYIMYQNRLYKVIASISVGETLTVGTNIQATTIMEELLALTA